MLKKVLYTFGTLALVANSTYAQDLEDSVEYTLTAQVETICGIDASSASTDIDFGTLSDVDVADQVNISGGLLNIVCNVPGTITVTYSSANNGVLVREGAVGTLTSSDQIPYEMSVFDITAETGADLGFDQQQLTNNITTSLTPISSASEGNAILAPTFFVNGVKLPSGSSGIPIFTAFAGDYSDTVTISVSAQ